MEDGLIDLNLIELERIRNLYQRGFTPMFTQVNIFESTMRDGEASARVHFTPEVKAEFAQAMDAAGVATIEAGFPGVAAHDAEAVRAVAAVVKNAEVAALAGPSHRQVEAAVEAVADAVHPVVHVYAPVSDEAIARRRGRTRVEMVRKIREYVAAAARHVPVVQFSAMDATRAERPFLRQCVQVAIDAGASRIGVPDSNGVVGPKTYVPIIRDIVKFAGPDVTVSAHCHGDPAMAVENAIAAIYAGARQVEVAMRPDGVENGNADSVQTVVAIEGRWPGRTQTNVVALARAEAMVHRAMSGGQVVPTQVPCARTA